MPAHAKGSISHVVLDDDGKIKETLSFKTGDYISDEQLDILGNEYSRSVVNVAHNEHTCPLSCADESHGSRTRVTSNATALEDTK